MVRKTAYRRVLIKLSGEALSGEKSFGIEQAVCDKVAYGLNELRKSDLELGVVIGGGNIFRGASLEQGGMGRRAADKIGMLGTMINGIALSESLNAIGTESAIMSAIDCPRLFPFFEASEAQKKLSAGITLIFVGGTSHPYFTTDTAASLRASEIGADVLLKATKVDGVYDKDPLRFADARRYDRLTFSRALAEDLKVMDATSMAFCRARKMPVIVFKMDLLMEGRVAEIFTKNRMATLVEEN